MNSIPNVGDMFYYATRANIYPFKWDGSPTDVAFVKSMGVFPFIPDGRELANWQRAFLLETSKFWEWVDGYELRT